MKDHFLWSMFEHFRERLQERIFEKHDITGHRGSNTISSFFYFFFFLFGMDPVTRATKRIEEQEVATALRTACNIPRVATTWIHRLYTQRRTETMPAGQKRQKTRTQCRGEAMCEAGQRKRVHVLSPCLFSNDRIPRNARETLLSFLLNLLYVCTSPIWSFDRIEPTSPNK